MALVFFAASLWGADSVPAASPLGLTRDQVLSRYGDPKSQIAVGNRLVMFFAKERLVLRDGVVVEVERLAADTPVRRPPGAPAETTPAAAPAAPAAPAPTPARPAPSGPQEGLDPRAPAAPAPAAAPATPETPPSAQTAAPAANATTPPAAATPPPEPKLAIKQVRLPAGPYSRPAGKSETPAPQPAPTVSVAVPPAAPAPVAPPVVKPAAVAPGPVVATAPSVSPPAEPVRTTTPVTPTEPETVTPDEDEKAEALKKAEAAAREKKFKAAKARRRLEQAGEEEPEFTEAFFTTRSIVIAILVIGGGIGYLIWRARQRQLEMAATAVSRSPFNAPAAASSGGGSTFSADLLGKMEWKRFEELVASYYNKTGVVAERTKAGPTAPVHLKIAWKGEPRPFAYVLCIPHPLGLVDSKPLQELVTALAADDIRRGYVVTTGKFNVPARDFAEEKHITLLPGDIFLEKLNALPDAARTEIMQSMTTGDYQIPSCPKCDAKMVSPPEDQSIWRCAAHADQIIPVWK